MNFSYFDQFKDMEVDLTPYLSGVTPDYKFSNRQPVKTTVKNLFEKYSLNFDYTKNVDFIYKYTIEEGDAPDVVSFKNYETVDFWWLIFVFNNIQNPFLEWPLSHEQINQLSDTLFEKENKFTRNTYYELLFEKNESLREIILPSPSIITEIVWGYQQQIIENT